MGDEDLKGVDGVKMSSAVEELDSNAQNLTSWNDSLLELRDLVISDWLGGAAEQFQGSYQTLYDTMMLMVDCAKTLANTSQDSIDAYTAGDDAVQQMVEEALRIGLIH